MPICISRILLLIETILLLLPVTIVSVIFGPVLILSPLRDDGSVELALIAVVSILSLSVGWLLTSMFVFGKMEIFRKIGGIGLLFSLTGVIISLIGLGISIQDPSAELSIFVFGCPAIVVFAHLLVEWMCRKN